MLNVCGIAFFQAEEQKRRIFQFDERRLVDAMVRLKRESRADGVVLLATCDRLEVWSEGAKGELWEPMCRALGIPVLAWKQYAYAHADADAVDYLFSLACGLYSPLFGEDTIISQIEGASRLSRQAGCATPVTQRLMQSAVSAAKKVHDSLNLEIPEETLPPAIERLVQTTSPKKMLVIGSSATARMVASYFKGKGWQVAMTLRDLRKTELVPPGVQAVGYDNRYELLPGYPVIVSATKGLGYALDGDAPLTPSQLVFDLANPHDISPELTHRCGLVCDDALVYERRNRQKAVAESRGLIEAKKAEYYAWKRREADHDTLKALAERAAQDLLYRMHGPLGSLGLDDGRIASFRGQLADLAFKSFVHELYRQGLGQVVDLTRKLENAPALYPCDPAVRLIPYLAVGKDGCNLTKLEMGSHAGTHLDAPRHLFPDGMSLDQYPPQRFQGEAVVLRLDGHLEIPDRVAMVLFATGWGPKWGTAAYRSGYPTLTGEQMEIMVEKGIQMVGFDCPSPDVLDELPNHKFLLRNDILILENVADVTGLVGKRLKLTVSPLLFSQSDGAPVRVFACF